MNITLYKIYNYEFNILYFGIVTSVNIGSIQKIT